jgi:hypothetical protein
MLVDAPGGHRATSSRKVTKFTPPRHISVVRRFSGITNRECGKKIPFQRLEFLKYRPESE